MNRTIGHIAVVGAGIAGLTTRVELAAAGFRVTSFDKGRGPGGRTSRRRAESYEFDHGAQYFTARDPRFRAVVDRWVEAGSAAVWDARIGSLRNGRWVAGSGSTPRYVGVPGMNQPAKELAEAGSGELHLGTRVHAMVREGSDGPWRLHDEDGGLLVEADAVVLTVPPEQALTLCDAVPAAQQPLAAAEVDPCWTVMAVFDPPLDRELDPGWDGAFVNEGALAWVARNGSKPGRPATDAWVLHAGGEWSRRYLEQERDWVQRALLSAFFETVGLPPRDPVWVAAHRWRYARPRNQPVDRFWWSPEERLGLCGDWCVGGRVEGAFLSACALSNAIRVHASSVG